MEKERFLFFQIWVTARNISPGIKPNRRHHQCSNRTWSSGANAPQTASAHPNSTRNQKRRVEEEPDQILHRLVRFSADAFLFNSVLMACVGLTSMVFLGTISPVFELSRNNPWAFLEALHVGRPPVLLCGQNAWKIDDCTAHNFSFLSFQSSISKPSFIADLTFLLKKYLSCCTA